MLGIRWNLQEQESGAEGGSGDTAVSRKQYVEKQVEERYTPRDVRVLLAQHGDKAEIALEHAIKQHNEMVERLMKESAGLKYDLEAAQKTVAARDAEIKTAQTERDALKGELDGIAAKGRAETVNALLKTRFADDSLALRHKAYLALEGYGLDVQGEGDKAKLVVTKGDQRHNFETVVNDDFYSRYSDAKPASDTPIQGNGIVTPPVVGSGKFDPIAGAELWAKQDSDNAKLSLIPGRTS